MTTAGARPWSVRLIHVIGWIVLACGAAVLLYLVYSLLFTNVSAERAQDDLRSAWDGGQSPDPAPAGDASDAPSQAPSEAATDDVAPPPGDAVALIEFVRPGRDDPIVHDDPLVVLEGVAVPDLQRGPGHYPSTAMPGRDGNFAVAGHRTTYGAPFFHLDVLRTGDEIVVTDRRRRRHTYSVVEQRVVGPSDVSVIAPDPLDSGRPTLTLTTCNPRFSAAQRLIVHAELVS